MIIGNINYGSLLAASNHIGVSPQELQQLLLEANSNNHDIIKLLCMRFNVPYKKSTTFVARRIFERKQDLADFLEISPQGLNKAFRNGRTIDEIMSVRNRDKLNGATNLKQSGLEYISEEDKSRLQGNHISLNDAQVIKRVFQFNTFSETCDFILKHRPSRYR